MIYHIWWGRSANMLCYWCCCGVGINTGSNVSDGVRGVIGIGVGGYKYEYWYWCGSVLKKGFGILNFAEAPN